MEEKTDLQILASLTLVAETDHQPEVRLALEYNWILIGIAPGKSEDGEPYFLYSVGKPKGASEYPGLELKARSGV